MRGDDPGEAQNAMQQALALDPYNYQAHAGLGQILAGLKKWAEARRQLEFVRQYFPDEDARTYSTLFHIANALGDPRSAAEALRFGHRMFRDDSYRHRLNVRNC